MVAGRWPLVAAPLPVATVDVLQEDRSDDPADAIVDALLAMVLDELVQEASSDVLLEARLLLKETLLRFSRATAARGRSPATSARRPHRRPGYPLDFLLRLLRKRGVAARRLVKNTMCLVSQYD